jgi:hypothetical protein
VFDSVPIPIQLMHAAINDAETTLGDELDVGEMVGRRCDVRKFVATSNVVRFDD